MSHHFVTLLILGLYVTNVGWYAVSGDVGRAGYWFFAAGITVTATWFVR